MHAVSHTQETEENVSKYLLEELRAMSRDTKGNQNKQTKVSYLNILKLRDESQTENYFVLVQNTSY